MNLFFDALAKATAPRRQWPFMVQPALKRFEVRYGKDTPFEVLAESADQVWEQHVDAAGLQGKGLSVRPIPEAPHG